MKKIISGIIALIVPLLLFAQTAKEAQDLSQVQKKLSSLEKDNVILKRQVATFQKTLTKMNEAEVKEQSDLAKHDSVARASQDTVRSYSGRLLKSEADNVEIEHALSLRSIAFIVVLIILVLLIVIRLITHRAQHHKDLNEILEKMKAQRDEREKRIADLRLILEKSEQDFSAMKKETAERLTALNENIAHIDRNLQSLLSERSDNLEHQIKDGLGRIRKDTEDVNREFMKKLEDLQALASSKISELGQKVADSGKKLDDQITAAHKKTDELKTVMAREIQAIRSKFE